MGLQVFPVSAKSLDQYRAYIEARQPSYSNALDHPLTEGCVLQTRSKSTFNYSAALGESALQYTVCSPPRLLTLSNDLYPSPRSDAGLGVLFANCDGSIHLVLKRPMSTGSGWAQTWLASVHSIGRVSLQVNVVVKVFQGSLFPMPEFIEYRMGLHDSAAVLYHKEAWAYNRLQRLQGTLLPYSYGFYDFRLPTDETACGHVIEWIEGHELERNYPSMIDGSWESRISKAQRLIQIERFVDCVHQFHLLGVIHRDLRPSNVLRPVDNPEYFVFLDFAVAAPARQLGTGRSGPKLFEIEITGIWNCLQEIEDPEVVADWIIEQIAAGARWTEIFREGNGVDADSSYPRMFKRAAASNAESFREIAGRRAGTLLY